MFPGMKIQAKLRAERAVQSENIAELLTGNCLRKTFDIQ